MNDFLLVDFAFVGTVVDPNPVRTYLLNAPMPGLQAAINEGADESIVTTLFYGHCVQYNLCQYVAGQQRTLFNTNRQVREFQSVKPRLADSMIRLVIVRLRKHFLANEWYELMPRFEKAVVRIEKLLKQSE